MNKQLQIFRKINELAEHLYTNEQSSHVEFLSDCHKALAKYFEEYFGDKFIFSALSFSKDDKLHYVDEATDNGYIFNKSVKNWEQLSRLFTKYIKEVSDNEIISITKILLDKNNTAVRKDLFFTCCENCKYDSEIIGNGQDAKVFEHELGIFNEEKETYYKTNRTKLDKFYEAFSHRSYEQNKNLYDRYIWDYHELAQTYKTANNKSDFLLHFIKPSIAELDYGLLLSLATNRQLMADELAFVNLILYRVVSQTATEKIKEAAESLHNISIHVFKTSIKADIIREINTIETEDNKNELAGLKNNANQLFILTGIINLLTKISRKEDFVKTALNDEILSETNSKWSINEIVEQYSKRLYKDKRCIILLTEESKNVEVSEIKIYDKYFSATLVQCFLNTILENVETHGKVQDIGEKEGYYLEICSCENGWVFRNEAKEKFNVADRKLTGNLLLFKSLFEKTKSGEMEINCNETEGKILFELKLKRN